MTKIRPLPTVRNWRVPYCILSTAIKTQKVPLPPLVLVPPSSSKNTCNRIMSGCSLISNGCLHVVPIHVYRILLFITIFGRKMTRSGVPMHRVRSGTASATSRKPMNLPPTTPLCLKPPFLSDSKATPLIQAKSSQIMPVISEWQVEIEKKEIE